MSKNSQTTIFDGFNITLYFMPSLYQIFVCLFVCRCGIVLETIFIEENKTKDSFLNNNTDTHLVKLYFLSF